MFRKLIVLFAVAASVLALAGCASGPEKISVTTTEFKFDPLTWEVSAGKEVELTIVNEGALEHEWVIIKQGQEVTIPFDADDEDKVYWEMEALGKETKSRHPHCPQRAWHIHHCVRHPAHLEAGMTGTLTVK